MNYQEELLLLIEERCEGGGYFLPRSYQGEWCNRLGREIVTGGSGTALSLKALARKGLIAFEPKLGDYACRITEEGKLHAQTLA